MHRQNTPSAWYVVETHVRGEAQAQRNLEQQGYTSFCPRFRQMRRHARRVDYRMAPVFPGYLFVHFDRQQGGRHAINGTLGVKRLVGPSNNKPQPMPAPAMEALLERCEGDVISGLFAELEPGQPVRLISGPFANALAQVERLDGRGRVHVLLDILGGIVPLRVDLGAVGPA